MATGEVSQITRPVGEPVKTWRETISEMDWKIHSLVALSYLLTAIGITLAFSSFYIAFVIHPMVAVASPILPIAAGVLLRKQADANRAIKALPSTPPPVIDKPKPLGIARPIGYMNCWCNATLQLFFHLPAFVKQLENIPYLKELYKEYLDNKPIDSQQVREWLYKQKAIDAKDPAISIDVLDVLQYWMNQFEQTGPKPLFERLDHSPHLDAPYPRLVNDMATFPMIVLNDGHFDATRSFPKAALSFFWSTEKIADIDVNGKRIPEATRETVCLYLEPPKELSFAVSGNAAEEPPAPHTGALEFTLGANCTGVPTTYGTDGFIIRSGRGGGLHYTAAFKMDETWYLANDANVKELSNEELEAAISQATFIHYVAK